MYLPSNKERRGWAKMMMLSGVTMQFFLAFHCMVCFVDGVANYEGVHTFPPTQ